ncbi:adhesin [Pseudonocardia sp. RS11V-5]|uniref:adhesin n=1 Tax=Pseudonocardia terrae TaxID=2905831 RepID=UPI001E2E7108|nr:adhesin [Pseudonocardia terrae]MCE3552450.1 adhesin [Pseudonocardia terrae]
MLAITDTAAEAIKSLTTDAELPDGGGLRIAATDPEQGLELSLAAQADQSDTVLHGEGLNVFLEPMAAEVLEDKVLDVQPFTNEEGQEELRFAIGPQGAPEAGAQA